MASGDSEKKLYKIGEVCRLADVQPYVLRYWETEFAPLAPNKSGGGQRLYNEREIGIIQRIKELLYTEGFTIAGAKKKLDLEVTDGELVREPAPTMPAAKLSKETAGTSRQAREILEQVRGDLREIAEKLRY